jgi:hypothetical protein
LRPDELHWRDGAYHEAIASSILLTEAPPSVDMDDLAHHAEAVNSIARLIAEKRSGGDLDRFKKAVLALRSSDTQTLILRIATTSDALLFWAIHVSLDKRDIQPCLRWPKNDSTPQMEFLTWLADVHWFAKRNPGHTPLFRAWQRLLLEDVNTPAWRERGYRIFVSMYGHQNLSAYGTRGLALSSAQRQPLMMFPSARMAAARLQLQPARFALTREILYSHAMAHPDKSHLRRAGLWRVSILSGHRPAATLQNWKLLSGESVTRQVISRRLTAIKATLKNGQAERET